MEPSRSTIRNANTPGKTRETLNVSMSHAKMGDTSSVSSNVPTYTFGQSLDAKHRRHGVANRPQDVVAAEQHEIAGERERECLALVRLNLSR